jgi:hypothetical protein
LNRGKSSLLKNSNITETVNKVKAIPPLSELTSVMKDTIYNNCGHCLSDPALFRSVNWVEEEERNISDRC